MEYLSLVVSAFIFAGSVIGLVVLIINKSKRKNDIKNDTPPKESSVDKKTSDLIPDGRYLTDNECFELKENGYMDIIEIRCKDLINASDSENDYDCLKFTKLYRTYPDDIKLISLNFPSNTKEQQNFFKHKIEHTKNQIQKYWLEKMLIELIWIEKNNTNREFYFMVFAVTLEDMYEKKEIITKVLGKGKKGLINDISHKKKEDILFKINNKNAFIL